MNLAKRTCQENSEGQTDPEPLLVAEFLIKFRTHGPGKRSDSLGQKLAVVFQHFPSPNTAEWKSSTEALLAPLAAEYGEHTRF